MNSWRLIGAAGTAASTLMLLAACTTSVKVGPEAVAGLSPDATIDMQEVQAAFLASGGGGSGTLFYQGKAYPFSTGGLGVGGIGASTLSASKSTSCRRSRSSPAPMPRHVTAMLLATRAAAICGCRTGRA